MRLCNTTCMCRLALAWVTSENSTSTGMPTSFDSIFFAGPYLVCYCLRSPVLTAPVRGSTPTLFAVPPLSCPVANCSRPGPVVNSLSRPLTTSGYGEISGPKKSFVWFCAEIDKGIICSGHPYSATYPPSYPCHLFTINYNTIQQQAKNKNIYRK